MSGGDAWPAPWAGECAADAGLLMGCLLSSTVQRAHGPGRGPCVSGASGAGGSAVGPAGRLELFLWRQYRKGGQGCPTKNYEQATGDRKSTRLNSNHKRVSHAVFCFEKKKKRVRQRLGTAWCPSDLSR